MNRIILSIILSVCFNNIYAQSDFYIFVKTPTNVSIEAIYRIEYSSNQLAQIEADAEDWLNDHNSNALRIAPASRTYNCHNYAWHSSDGGSKCWVNQKNQYDQINLAKYWTGTSPTYELTINTKATKVFYPNGDHSAKVISINVFESKWGE